MISDLVSDGLHGDPADFVGQLLSPEPKKRPSATEALKHSWFRHLPNKRDLEQRYQQSIRAWKSRPRNHFGTDPIVYLTTANPFATYCPRREPHTSSTPTAEEFTLFPNDDHVSESSYGDAPPSRPQFQQRFTPTTHIHPGLNPYSQNPTIFQPEARAQDLMNHPFSAVQATPAAAPQRDMQFVSQVERLHAEQQLPKGNYLYIAPAELPPTHPPPPKDIRL